MTLRGLGDLLRQRAMREPGRSLFTFGDQTVSLGQVEERTNRLAHVLTDNGVRHGDRVAVMIANGIVFPVAWLAIAKVGAVMVPLNTTYRSEDVTHLIADSGATMALVTTVAAARLLREAGVARIGLLAPDDGSGSAAALAEADVDGGMFDVDVAMRAASPEFDAINVDRDDVLSIQYTSGTTGLPKGCVLTHGYWLSLAEQVTDLIGLTEADVAATAQPFSYLDPQWNAAACLWSGARLVILPRFSASTFWKSIVDEGVTFIYLVGTMPVYLYKQPDDPVVDRGHRVRLVMCSGIVAQLHAEFERRWGVCWREVYGLTEVPLVLATAVDDVDSVGSGLVGRPAPGMQVRLVDGELVVHGWPMMRGYWNNREATNERLHDGWFATGDLATVDAQGRYRLVGRRKDMIRRSGENIAAAEVEAVLAQHPAVHMAAVVAVADELRGEEAKAYIRAIGSPSAAEIVEFVRQRLAPFKVPRYIEFVEDFPMTPSERVAKHLLSTAVGCAVDTSTMEHKGLDAPR